VPASKVYSLSSVDELAASTAKYGRISQRFAEIALVLNYLHSDLPISFGRIGQYLMRKEAAENPKRATGPGKPSGKNHHSDRHYLETEKRYRSILPQRIAIDAWAGNQTRCGRNKKLGIVFCNRDIVELLLLKDLPLLVSASWIVAHLLCSVQSLRDSRSAETVSLYPPESFLLPVHKAFDAEEVAVHYDAAACMIEQYLLAVDLTPSDIAIYQLYEKFGPT